MTANTTTRQTLGPFGAAAHAGLLGVDPPAGRRGDHTVAPGVTTRLLGILAALLLVSCVVTKSDHASSEPGGTAGAGTGGTGPDDAGGTAGNDATGGTAGNVATGGTAGNVATGGTAGNDATGGTAGNDATGGPAGDDPTGGTGGTGGTNDVTGGGAGAGGEGGSSCSLSGGSEVYPCQDSSSTLTRREHPGCGTYTITKLLRHWEFTLTTVHVHDAETDAEIGQIAACSGYCGGRGRSYCSKSSGEDVCPGYSTEQLLADGCPTHWVGDCPEYSSQTVEYSCGEGGANAGGAGGAGGIGGASGAGGAAGAGGV